MPDSNLNTSISAMRSSILSSLPTATISELIDFSRIAKGLNLSNDAVVETAINDRALSLVNAGATQEEIVKISSAIKSVLNPAILTLSTSDVSNVSSSVIPATDIAYDLGSTSNKWKDIYLDGSTIDLDGKTISAAATGIEINEVLIGSDTNKVKLTATTDGKLEQTGTDSNGVTAVPKTTTSSTSTVTNFSDLTSIGSPSVGQSILVTSTNKMYIFGGTGWYLIAEVTNQSPTAITGLNATYDLAIDGTATTITLVSTDPEGDTLTWGHTVTTGTLGSTATITNVDNVFTITPSTTKSDAGEFSVTFNVTDGSQAATSVSAFTLVFVLKGTLQRQVSNIDTGEDSASAYTSFSDRIAVNSTHTFVGNPAENAPTSYYGNPNYFGTPDNGRGYIYIYNNSTGNETRYMGQGGDVSWAGKSRVGEIIKANENYFVYNSIGENGWNGIVRVWKRDANNESYALDGWVSWYNKTGTTGRTDNSWHYFGQRFDISETYLLVSQHQWANPSQLSGGTDGKMHLFNLDTGALVQEWTRYTDNSLDYGLGEWHCAVCDLYSAWHTGWNDEIFIANNVAGTIRSQKITPNNSNGWSNNFKYEFRPDGSFIAVANAGDEEIEIFNPSTGAHIKTLTNPASAGDLFADNFAVTQNYLVIGAHRADVGANNSGSVYVYTIPDVLTGTWTPILTLNGENDGDFFGSSFAVSDEDVLAIGATGYDDTMADGYNVANSGQVYIYT